MPFVSRRQQRAAFGGHIPGFSKAKAKEWADKTDFSRLPERAPGQKGKPSLRKQASPFRLMARLRAQGFRDPVTEVTREASSSRSDFVRTLGEEGSKAWETASSPRSARGPLEQANQEQERRKKAEALVPHFAKLASLIQPQKTRVVGEPAPMASAERAGRVGQFRGVSTDHSLKPPGPGINKTVLNPGRNIRNAMNTFRA